MSRRAFHPVFLTVLVLLLLLCIFYSPRVAQHVYDKSPSPTSADQQIASHDFLHHQHQHQQQQQQTTAVPSAVTSFPSSPTSKPPSSSSSCPPLPGIENVQIVLKTGAASAKEKLPVHFSTTLRCVPNYVIYSDLAEEIDGHQVQDALDETAQRIIEEHPEFDLYRRLRAQGRAALSQGDSGSGSAGWTLDKWKFLPIVEKLWRDAEHDPSKHWFVIMEDDTYISWSNLLHYLSFIDYTQPFYGGAEMEISPNLFAHGGSGFVISREALRMAVERRRADVDRYDGITSTQWAGDCALGILLVEVDVKVFWAWPNFQGLTPYTIDVSTSKYEHRAWCHGALTWHHVSPQEIQELWNFDLAMTSSSGGLPWTHGDLFEGLIMPRMLQTPYMLNWDNRAEETVSDADLESVEAVGSSGTEARCRAFCESRSLCVQYRVLHDEATCMVSTRAILGTATSGVTSGWVPERVAQFRDDNGQCERTVWILP